jgi:hypothetical protein
MTNVTSGDNSSRPDGTGTFFRLVQAINDLPKLTLSLRDSTECSRPLAKATIASTEHRAAAHEGRHALRVSDESLR